MGAGYLWLSQCTVAATASWKCVFLDTLYACFLILSALNVSSTQKIQRRFVPAFPQIGSSMGLWLGLGVAQAFTSIANFFFYNNPMCRCKQLWYSNFQKYEFKDFVGWRKPCKNSKVFPSMVQTSPKYVRSLNQKIAYHSTRPKYLKDIFPPA